MPRKNLRMVGKHSLIGRAVIAAKGANSINEVYVSTDDDEIASEATRCGAKVIKRPANISGDMASSEEGWLHALHEVNSKGHNPDYLAFLQCTSPFTTSEDLDGCIKMIEDTQASCVLSVIEDHAFTWKWPKSGSAVGVNHDEKVKRQRRQDLDKSYKESGAFYVVKSEDFKQAENRFCGDIALYEVQHPPIEIDTEDDLEICNSIELGRRQKLTGNINLDQVKALVMDFDGVHTNDKVMVDQNGLESVQVSRSDGMGIERLRRFGSVEMLILSKEQNPVVQQRAKKLKIECLNGIDNKLEALENWISEKSLTWDDVLYVGNDVNDIEVLKCAGIACCPSDAHPSVIDYVDWQLPTNGGDGVLRYISDKLLLSTE